MFQKQYLSAKIPKVQQQDCKTLLSLANAIQDQKTLSKEDELQEKRRLLGPRTNSVGLCQGLDKALAALVNDPDSAQILRNTLIAERSRGHESKLNSFKHFYVVGSSAAGTTETAVILFNPAQGTGTSNRLTNDVRLHRITCRIRISRNITTVGTAAIVAPTVSLVIGRTKVPSSPGAVATIFGTGANPPSSSSTIYDGLASAIVPLMVRNINTADMYHVYKHFTHCRSLDNFQYTTAGSLFGIDVPHQTDHVFELDLHKLEQTFVTPGNTDTLINQLWFVFRSDIAYTNLGFNDTISYTFDTEFKDVQD